MLDDKATSNEVCIFCNGTLNDVYILNNYSIFKCQKCNVIGVRNMPREDTLRQYYQGFSFQADIKNFENINTPKVRDWMTSLVPNNPATMLDIGGGGGFFAKAFENFNLGNATYIDLDNTACSFAEKTMELGRVYNGTLEKFCVENPGVRFDFIYLRHVVEHLIDPVKLILQCTEILTNDGILVVQCPNGQSKEGLLFLSYWLRFLTKAAKDNRWSAIKAMLFSLTKDYGWGIDPPRHLWAISSQSLQSVFFQNETYRMSISTASLANPVFSPYWRSKSVFGRARDWLCNALFGSVFSGMHLIAYIQPKSHNKHRPI